MGIKVKNRDPKSTDFSGDDIIINHKEGTLFFKSDSAIIKLSGEATSTSTTATAAVAQNATTLATGDQIFDFVTGFGYAPLNSPEFTGTPLSTTPSVNDDSTKIATTAYVIAQGYTGATDISGKADKASPTFSGTITIPNISDLETAVSDNTLKNTNVPTTLQTGTVNATSYGITSDGSVDDIVLAQATTNYAGLLSATKFDEIVNNTLKNTNVEGNLGVIPTTNSLTITTSNGTSIAIPAATTNDWGAMTDTNFDDIANNTTAIISQAAKIQEHPFRFKCKFADGIYTSNTWYGAEEFDAGKAHNKNFGDSGGVLTLDNTWAASGWRAPYNCILKGWKGLIKDPVNISDVTIGLYTGSGEVNTFNQTSNGVTGTDLSIQQVGYVTSGTPGMIGNVVINDRTNLAVPLTTGDMVYIRVKSSVGNSYIWFNMSLLTTNHT